MPMAQHGKSKVERDYFSFFDTSKASQHREAANGKRAA